MNDTYDCVCVCVSDCVIVCEWLCDCVCVCAVQCSEVHSAADVFGRMNQNICLQCSIAHVTVITEHIPVF